MEGYSFVCIVDNLAREEWSDFLKILSIFNVLSNRFFEILTGWLLWAASLHRHLYIYIYIYIFRTFEF